jgi:DNA polymerase-3 subunit epsilon
MEEQRQRVVLGDDARTIRDPYTCDIVFFDVETTGLAPEYHDLIEIGAIRVRQSDLSVVCEYSTKVRPNNIDRASPGALRVNGYTPEGWKDAVSLRVAMLSMLDIVRDAALCAHKAAFDEYFLYHFGVNQLRSCDE